MFNSMGGTISETFESRATKFEEDLLLSFGLSKEALTTKFSGYIAQRGFASKFMILSAVITNYLATVKQYYSYKSFSLILSPCQMKIGELSTFENKLILAFQKKCVSLFLYPLIFTTSKNNVVSLAKPVSASTLSVVKINTLSLISR